MAHGPRSRRGCWVQYELDGERFFFQLISSHLDVNLGHINGDQYERDTPFVAPDGKTVAGVYFVGAVFHQDAVLENLRRRKISHVDLAGRVFIRRERLFIDRSLSPLARTWPIKKPKKALTEKTRAALDESVGRILYILLQNPACKWNTSRMQQASGLSTGCVYKALKELRAFGWINSYGHGDWRVLNTDEIARVLRVEKSRVVPIGSAAQLSRVFKDTVLPDFPGKLMPGAAEGFLRFQFDGVEFNLKLRPVLDIRKSDISARLRKYLTCHHAPLAGRHQILRPSQDLLRGPYGPRTAARRQALGGCRRPAGAAQPSVQNPLEGSGLF